MQIDFHVPNSKQGTIVLCDTFLPFQSNEVSVLSSMWMKEYQDIPVSKFNQYKDMQLTSILVGKKPIYCVVEAESIVNHCLLIPYQAPSCFFLLIKDPMQWSNEFHNIK